MALLKLGSTNPKLSFILSKNPQTIRFSGEAFTRTLRKGNLYGWFSKADDSEFKLFFKDSDTECSFVSGLDANFEYLDKTRYTHPFCYMSMVTTALASALKVQHEFDTEDYLSHLILQVDISNRAIAAAFAKHFTEYVITITPISGGLHNVVISGKSVQGILNLMIVFCLVQCLYDRNTYLPLEGEAVNSYLRALNRCDAPYFIRYLFSKTVFRDFNTFNKYKKQIQLPNTDMNYGDTRRHRFTAVTKELTGGTSLLDIGCGDELFYTKRMAKNYDDVYSFDADEYITENNAAKVKAWQLTNVSALGAMTPEYVEFNPEMFEGADVLLTEVIEHMPMEDAKNLISAILKTNFKTFLVTTPNRDFNVNYLMSYDEMRHDDHKWEMSLGEFEIFINALAFDVSVEVGQYEITGIGDSVNDVPTSLMVVFKKGTK